MKSWRTRLAVGLAAGAAAVTVPLTATGALADTASTGTAHTASGWEIAGGWSYPQGEAFCEQEAREDYFPQGFTDVDCVADPGTGPDFYTIWIYRP